jgi:lysozyme family protein
LTTADYKPFVERMIQRYEGGYGWDKNDSGGPTKYGITCYDLAEHRHEVMSSMTTWAPIVKAMSLAEADDIYAQKYATACRFVELGAGKDCVVFDFGVNSGPSRAIKYAQGVVGVRQDGILGPVTLAAINAVASDRFINGLCDDRLGFLKSLRIWSTFGRGWAARVRDLRAYSLALLAPSPKALKRFQAKPHRIPKAFAKAYGEEELKALQQ